MTRTWILAIVNIGGYAAAVAAMLLGFAFVKPLETVEQVDLGGSTAVVEWESTRASIRARVRFAKVAPPLDGPADRLGHALAILVEDEAGNGYRFSGGGPRYRLPKGEKAADFDLTGTRGFSFRALKAGFVFRPRAAYLLVHEKTDEPLTTDRWTILRRLASADPHLAQCEGWLRVRGYLDAAPGAEDVIELISVRYAEGLTTRVALHGDGRVRVAWQGAALSRPCTVEYAVEGPEKDLLHDAFHVAARDGLLDAEDARNRLADADAGEARYGLAIAGRRNTFRTVNASPEPTLALQRIAGYFLAQGLRRQKGEPNLREALDPTRPTGPARPTLKTSPAP